jgi:SAM-dependent methyltransferase
MASRDEVPEEVIAHYALGAEGARLSSGSGRLERARTEEVLARWLPAPPARILDVGGGPGTYVAWLAARGYEVHLVDPVPLHVEQALAAGARSARVGDARRLEEDDASHDAVLLLGPLYHIAERAGRVAAVAEAGRVVREGGVVAVAAISRFASLFDGLFRGALDDPAFRSIVERDLADGQHRNPTSRPEWFTTAFFHHPAELRAEVAEAGLGLVDLVGLEGPAWLLSDVEKRWADGERRERLLAAARAVESEPTLLGLSAHLLAVAKRSGPTSTTVDRDASAQ